MLACLRDKLKPDLAEKLNKSDPVAISLAHVKALKHMLHLNFMSHDGSYRGSEDGKEYHAEGNIVDDDYSCD